VRGRIHTVYFAKPQFSAGKLKTKEGHTLHFAGPFFAREGEQVVLCGTWEEHPKFGKQLKVAQVELDLPVDADGLANYLANHPRIKGIGPVKARKIAELFGPDFDEVISENPQVIAAAVRLPPVRSVSTLMGLPSRSSMVWPIVGRTPTSLPSTHGPGAGKGSPIENSIVTPRGASLRVTSAPAGTTTLCSSPKVLFLAPPRKTL
jgi:hypothetical protein